MPRRARQLAGGIVYHVLNRGCGKMKLFSKAKDFDAFVELLGEAQKRFPGVRILSYCIMPNHWHLVLLPTDDGELSRFMFWLTMTHVQRWRHARQLVGLGPLYQGRFRAFAIEADEHLLTVLRYVERNALRAGLVDRAEDWKWSSLHVRRNLPQVAGELLSAWPIDEPADWVRFVNEPQTAKEEEAVRASVRQGRPFGSVQWRTRVAKLMGIDLEPRPRGRPKSDRSSTKRK